MSISSRRIEEALWGWRDSISQDLLQYSFLVLKVVRKMIQYTYSSEYTTENRLHNQSLSKRETPQLTILCDF